MKFIRIEKHFKALGIETKIGYKAPVKDYEIFKNNLEI